MNRLLAFCLLLLNGTAWAAGVEFRPNVAYYKGPDQDEYRHKLDLYLPFGEKNFKTVIFVHGGTWSMGSKDGFLMLPGHKAADHGKYFAQKGIAAVHINYRLSPKVKHPEHVVDVARAISWVKKNIEQYGGDPDQLYLMGHSAGGHLAALVTCDPKYLAAEKLDANCIKGVIGVSGVYALTADLVTNAGPVEAGQPTGAGVLLGHVFGGDCKCHHQASPIQQCRCGLPPFLIAYADRDLLTLPAQAVAFQEALAKKDVPAKKMLITGREHQTILKSMLNDGDPLGEAVLKLIRSGKLD